MLIWLEILETAFGHFYLQGGESKVETKTPHLQDKYSKTYEKIPFDQFWWTEGCTIGEGIIEEKKTPFVLFSQCKKSGSSTEVSVTQVRARDSLEPAFQIKDFVFSKDYVLRNFSDYGDILKLVGFVSGERDIKERPLSKDELLAGLGRLMAC